MKEVDSVQQEEEIGKKQICHLLIFAFLTGLLISNQIQVDKQEDMLKRTFKSNLFYNYIFYNFTVSHDSGQTQKRSVYLLIYYYRIRLPLLLVSLWLLSPSSSHSFLSTLSPYSTLSLLSLFPLALFLSLHTHPLQERACILLLKTKPSVGCKSVFEKGAGKKGKRKEARFYVERVTCWAVLSKITGLGKEEMYSTLFWMMHVTVILKETILQTWDAWFNVGISVNSRGKYSQPWDFSLFVKFKQTNFHVFCQFFIVGKKMTELP